MFDDILDKDEEIIKTFKPDKIKYWFSHLILNIFKVLWIPVFALIGVFAEEEPLPFETLYWSILVAVIFYGAIVLLQVLHYKKLFYAYTNKRILKKTGIIGVDYQALDMKMIGAVDVYTSIFDKILGRKTGTIKFGSMASPMNSNVSNYEFSHISNAYQTYREIKEQIELHK